MGHQSLCSCSWSGFAEEIRPFDLKETDYRKVEMEEYTKHTPGEEEAAKKVQISDLPGWKEVRVDE